MRLWHPAPCTIQLSGKADIERKYEMKKTYSRDKIIKMLKTTPGALEAFESKYHTQVLPNASDEDAFFKRDAKSAVSRYSTESRRVTREEVEKLMDRIVDELLSQTSTFIYDGKRMKVMQGADFVKSTDFIPVEIDEIEKLPKDERPQLTGRFMKCDIDKDSGLLLLELYRLMGEAKTQKKKLRFYQTFRQGLDVVDLDMLTYEMIGRNRNTMGHWLPNLISANRSFFRIPKTVIAKVPITLLQLTRNEFAGLTGTTKKIVDEWATKAFSLNPENEYFVKTGTYSSKFDFRNCHVHGATEVAELGEYLLWIHFAALQMAAPTTHPCIYGVSTTNEWCVREFIQDIEENPTIYKGLPLHTEYRAFVDCDTDTVLGIMPYWEPDTMKKRFDEHRDGHDEHDAIIFRAYEDTLMARYEKNKGLILKEIGKIMPDLNLKGQWSIDIMQNGDEFWLIDMAVAESSFGYEKVVEKKLRNPFPEDWLPRIQG